ncbi:MAG TPA: hypothetical protein VF103_07085 [Polyangiaceae bacterium]
MADAPDETADSAEPESPETSEADSVEKPSAVEAGSDTSTEPKKKKKKKKKKKRATEAEAKDEKPEGPVLGPEGWERPNFVLDFPKDEALDRLVRAFELGNYAFVRENGKKLAESSADEAVRGAARELLRRIEPDPLVRILFLMSIALFLFMVFYAYRSHGH